MPGGYRNERDWWDALLRKKYLTGRKFCPKCGKWRPIHDFHVDMRPNKVHPSGRPQHLRPRCVICERQRIRVERNYVPSLTGIGGQPKVWPSAKERNRAVVARRGEARKKEIARDKTEWARIHRRGAGIPPRKYADGRNQEEVAKWELLKFPPGLPKQE